MSDSMLTPWLALLIGASIKGVLLLLSAGVVVTVWRRASAAARHLVWTVSIASLLILPAFSVVFPTWHVTVPSTGPGFGLERAPEAAPAIGETQDSYSLAAATSSRQQEMASASVKPGAAVDPGSRLSSPLSLPTTEIVYSAAAEPSAPVQPVDWSKRLFLLWLAGAVLVLAPMVIGMLRVWRLARTASPVTGGRWEAPARTITSALGLQGRVRVLESEVSCMPMAWGIVHPVVLLPADADRWPATRQRDVLLHELAHVRRRDCLTQLIVQIVCAIYWFNPLVWLAAHRIRVEREQACDDYVLNAGSKASEYATHLLEVARSLRVPRSASLATVAMARRSHLSGRLLAVLDDKRSRQDVSRRFALPAWLAACCLVVPLAAFTPQREAADVAIISADRMVATPLSVASTASAMHDTARFAENIATATPVNGAPFVPVVLSGDTPSIDPGVITKTFDCRLGETKTRSFHQNIDTDDKTWKGRWTSGECTIDLRAKGELKFNADLSDVESITPGGYFELSEREGDLVRRIEITSNRDGQLTRTFYRNGTAQPFDAEAKRWLAGILIDLERRTAFAAETRVRRIFQERGADGVLEEINLMEGSYAKRIYFTKLFEISPKVDATTMRKALQLAGRELDSDYELAQLLISLAKRGSVDPTEQDAYIEAVGSIDSDYETRRALSALFQQQTVGANAMKLLLRVASEIDSDFELAELLMSIAEIGLSDATSRDAYFKAIATIDSDFEQRRVLTSLLKRGKVSREVVTAVLSSATALESDFERAELLLTASSYGLTDAPSRAAYFEAVRGIGSDFERRRVLSTLLRDKEGTNELRVELLHAAAEIDSDFELAEFLVAFLRTYEMNDQVWQLFRKTTKNIDSAHEYGRVMSALRLSDVHRLDRPD